MIGAGRDAVDVRRALVTSLDIFFFFLVSNRYFIYGEMVNNNVGDEVEVDFDDLHDDGDNVRNAVLTMLSTATRKPMSTLTKDKR